MDTYNDDDNYKERMYYESLRARNIWKGELKDYINKLIDEDFEYVDILDRAQSWNVHQEYKLYVKDVVNWVWSHPRKKKRPVLKGNG